MDEQDYLRAIAKSPLDEQLLQEYATWLFARGDNRGEILQIELELRAANRKVASLNRTLDSRLLFDGVDPAWLDEVCPQFVTSPMVGTFYSASSPESAPFVKVGDRCHASSVVCLIEALKVFNEIPAGISGIVSEVLVENGEGVEFGQNLFRLRRLPRLIEGW